MVSETLVKTQCLHLFTDSAHTEYQIMTGHMGENVQQDLIGKT